MHATAAILGAEDVSRMLRVYALCFFTLCLWSVPGFVRADYVQLFATEIDVQNDSTFRVAETIAYVKTTEGPGVRRCISTVHIDPPASPLTRRYVDIADIAVTVDGEATDFTIVREKDRLCIETHFDAAVQSSHTYAFSYLVGGAISYPKYGGADLYWDITGNAWTVPIRSVTARMTSSGLFLQERSCYQGTSEKGLSCTIGQGTGEVVSFSGNNLAAGDSLTISQALNRTAITHDVRESWSTLAYAIAGIIVVLIAGIYLLYWYATRKTQNLIE